MYPNIKYRVLQIESMPGFDVTTDIEQLQPKKHADQGVLSYLAYGLRTILGVLGLSVRAARSRPDLIYVTYPTPIVLIFLRIFRVQRHSRIYADLFISISETLIEDRGKIRRNSFAAKVIIALERFSLTGVTCVVDTSENASYLASFFGLPREQFQTCPLALAPHNLPINENASTDHDSADVYAYFVGTFVPLQGVPQIADAYLEAAAKTDLIPLIVRGNGQDTHRMRQRLDVHYGTGLQWRDQLAPSPVIEKEISRASLCIGIFGSTDKAERVIPFKIYQYLRAGRPILTLNTPALRRLEREFLNQCDGPSPFILVEQECLAEALAANLISDSSQRPDLTQMSESASLCFNTLLANNIAIRRLEAIFNSSFLVPSVELLE